MATKKKMVPVTSVTPASKVQAVSKAQQARTRALVMGIASATPVGRAAKVAATAAKASIKKKVYADAIKKFDAATEKRIADNIAKKSVTVKSSRTASGPGLETRGAKLTRAERAERAQDYQFDRSLGKYYSNQDRIAGTHPSDMPKNPRGQGAKSLRKSAAVKKEAKPVVKINPNKKK